MASESIPSLMNKTMSITGYITVASFNCCGRWKALSSPVRSAHAGGCTSPLNRTTIQGEIHVFAKGFELIAEPQQFLPMMI
ncbi:hypothetical protein JWG39_00820 [Desulforhopalus vacuolatus]|uniref:hypothetical protein n=1 Tax=Desulforhopalus vacuolatus TaxID=40414 RepID=UPI0019655DF1|nr:hypothetical protein [Desulforhopalus vacuolatus]MBM9518355.1 hypothetical protein [Desulforhopalus vacuolatus]